MAYDSAAMLAAQQAAAYNYTKTRLRPPDAPPTRLQPLSDEELALIASTLPAAERVRLQPDKAAGAAGHPSPGAAGRECCCGNPDEQPPPGYRFGARRLTTFAQGEVGAIYVGGAMGSFDGLTWIQDITGTGTTLPAGANHQVDFRFWLIGQDNATPPILAPTEATGYVRLIDGAQGDPNPDYYALFNGQNVTTFTVPVHSKIPFEVATIILDGQGADANGAQVTWRILSRRLIPVHDQPPVVNVFNVSQRSYGAPMPPAPRAGSQYPRGVRVSTSLGNSQVVAWDNLAPALKATFINAQLAGKTTPQMQPIW